MTHTTDPPTTPQKHKTQSPSSPTTYYSLSKEPPNQSLNQTNAKSDIATQTHLD